MADRRRRPHAPAVAPIDVDGVLAAAVGTLAWTVALLALALRRDELAATGRTWWLWTCLAGVGLGLIGLSYCTHRRDALRSAARGSAQPPA